MSSNICDSSIISTHVSNLPDSNSKNALYNIFINSKYCYNGKPKLYHITSKLYGGDSIFLRDEVEAEYWYGWSRGLQKVKNIGDPLAFLHYYGLCYINISYRSRIKHNLHVMCYDCGARGNIITKITYLCAKCSSSSILIDKKTKLLTCKECKHVGYNFDEACSDCNSKNISKYRFTEKLDTDVHNITDNVEFNRSQYLLEKVLSSINKDTRAYDLLEMFLSHEIEIDSDWKKVVAQKWGVSEFRVVLVWRKVKQLIKTMISIDDYI